MSGAPRALYVHIPFCSSICGYCDFTKLLYKKEWAKEYLRALQAEISCYSIGEVDTIYVGGGTPSCLEAEDLSFLLSFLEPLLAENGEFTLEGNPESFSEEKIEIAAHHGVNRVSLGVESSCPRLLSLMGRKASFAQAKKVIALLRKHGISNINADLIYALPNETEEELEADIAALLELKVPHLSTYSLILEPDSIFAKKGYQEASQDEQADSYERILASFREEGYLRYEVSNFAFPGFESSHNLVYWHNKPYFGVGLGASGYIGDIRYTNTKSLPEYLHKANKRAYEEKVGPKDLLSYYLLTHLRLAEGFSKREFSELFGADFLSLCPAAKKHFADGLLKESQDSIFPSDRGMLLLDTVLRDLI